MRKSKSIVCALVSLVTGVVMLAGPVTAQSRRVDPTARQILEYRLTSGSIQRVDAVMRSMDRASDRGSEGRADLAMMNALRSSSGAWRDTTVDEIVRTLDGTHPELIEAIRTAGTTTRDYVLTVMNLILAYPLAASRREGRGFTSTDVSVENVDLIEADWYAVDRLMRDIQIRMDTARRR